MQPMMQQPEPIAGGTSILQKLLAVMNDCGYIQKDKENTFHRYWYASEAAIKDRVHKALVEHRVIPQVSLLGLTEREITRFKDGKPQTSEWLTTANVHYKFYCIDTGEFIEGTFYGCGVDPSDKGLYKAITGAIKYLLTSQFLIPTGDDPEDDSGRTATKEEKKGKQDDYVRSKGLDPYVAPKQQKPVPANVTEWADLEPANVTMPDGRKAADVEDAMRTIEMRSAQQVAEAEQMLVSKPKAPKKGSVSFDVLKHFKLIKEEMREASGDDGAYYSVLNSFGYDKSNEITDNDKAREIYKALGAERNRLKQEKDLLATLEQASEIIGVREFSNILGAHGAETIADALKLEGDPLGALLATLKTQVDERKSKS